jgi:hypothetical protein
MRPYPYHYSRRNRSDDSIDPTLRFVLGELRSMESRLTDTIEGRYGGLEKRVAEVE